MGEMTEAVLDGIFCSDCFEYIGKAVGYPRTCRSCAGEALHQQLRLEKLRRKREGGK